MTRRILLAFTLLILTLTLSFGQETALFSFDRLHFGGRESMLLKATDWYFEVNGVKIRDRHASYDVPVRGDSLDVVVIHRGKQSSKALARFVPGQHYVFAGNECSGFELQTKDRKLLRTGGVRFRIVHGRDSTVVATVGISGETDFLQNELTTAYYSAIGSAMCQYVPHDIRLLETRGEGDYFEFAAFRFFFIQGEKLTVTWNYQTHKLSLRMDGYVKKGENLYSPYGD